MKNQLNTLRKKIYTSATRWLPRIGLALSLILSACQNDSPSSTEQEDPKQQNQDNNTHALEANDTTHIKELAHKYDSI